MSILLAAENDEMNEENYVLDTQSVRHNEYPITNTATKRKSTFDCTNTKKKRVNSKGSDCIIYSLYVTPFHRS